LVELSGADADQITTNGEIDKLASNIGLARDFAGIRWRSDYEWGLRLGEAVAISLLRDQSNDYAGSSHRNTGSGAYLVLSGFHPDQQRRHVKRLHLGALRARISPFKVRLCDERARERIDVMVG
jgi:hypothetical protein